MNNKIIKCPACGTKNKLREKSPNQAIFGKCHNPLNLVDHSSIINLTDNNFPSFISNSEKTVLVDFWARWCMPCRMMSPVLKKFSQSQNSIIVVKVDVDKNPRISSQMQINAVPTLVLFANGKEVKRITGFVTQQSLKSDLKPWLDKIH